MTLEEKATRQKMREHAAARLRQEFNESDSAFQFRVDEELAKDVHWHEERQRRARVEAAKQVLLANDGVAGIGAMADNNLLSEIFGSRK